MTDEELTAIEQRAAAATKGPWQECGHARGGCICGLVWSLPLDTTIEPNEDMPPTKNVVNDARFIANARQDIPALLAEVRRLRALPVVETCGGCPHYHAANPSCQHPDCPHDNETSAEVVPPPWCPLRRPAKP